jgi:hypothetical protein
MRTITQEMIKEKLEKIHEENEKPQKQLQSIMDTLIKDDFNKQFYEFLDSQKHGRFRYKIPDDIIKLIEETLSIKSNPKMTNPKVCVLMFDYFKQLGLSMSSSGSYTFEVGIN